MENYKSVKGYICEVECSSPKAEFIREFSSWFMAEDMDERIRSVLDDQIVWEMVGEATVEGPDAVMDFINHPPQGEEALEMIEQRVDGILVDGLWGSAFGTIIMSNGDIYGFNDIIRFRDGEEIMIEKMKSFIVMLKA